MRYAIATHADTPGNEGTTPNMVNTLNFYQSNACVKLTNEIRSFLSGVLIRSTPCFCRRLHSQGITSEFSFPGKEELWIT